MESRARLSLSCYQEVAVLNEAHNVFLVQHQDSKKIYVKKLLRRYNAQVFQQLMDHPVPHTPGILALAEEEGVLTVIEDYLPGVTLQERLDQCGCLSERETAALMLQLCDIVGALHGMVPPIIHRDIKPDNLMLTGEGTLCLLDLNAAREFTDDKAEDTLLMGTAGYAAPEQYGFGESSVQTDLYAMGVVMNVMLTGELPRDTPAAGPLGDIVRRCTMLKPGERYPHVQALSSALRRAQRRLGGHGYRDSDGIGQSRGRSLLPPGLRSGHPVVSALAGSLYTLLLLFTLTLETVDMSSAAQRGWRAVFTVTALAMVFFTGNYLGVQQRLPLSRSRFWPVRLAGILVWNAALLAAGFVALLLVSLL